MGNDMESEVENEAVGRERGHRLVMWREDVETLRLTLSDDDRREIVDALFDWFLGSDATLPGVLGMLLGRLVERQRLSVVRSKAGVKGGVISGESKRASRQNSKQTDSKTIANSKQTDSKTIANEKAGALYMSRAGAPARTGAYARAVEYTSTTSIDNTSTGQWGGKGGSGGEGPLAPRGAAEAPSQVASPTQSAALTAFPTEAEIVERKRTPPSLETVLAVARNLGIDADWARAFHADMTADGWCYINASGNTAMVNVINFGSVMRKRFQWAKEDRRDRQGGVSDEINEAARKIRIERDARLRALHEKEARAARKGGEA